MIYHWGPRVLALMPDGRMCYWDDMDSRAAKPGCTNHGELKGLQDENSRAAKPGCTNPGELKGLQDKDPDRKITFVECEPIEAIRNDDGSIILTTRSNNHILTMGHDEILRPVTPVACQFLGIDETEAVHVIEDIRTTWNTGMTVITRDYIGMVTFKWSMFGKPDHLSWKSVLICPFPEPFELLDQSGYYGLARTQSNRLYCIPGYVKNCESEYITREPIEILFHDVIGIRMTICELMFTLLLMDDGRVYAHGFTSLVQADSEPRNITFEQVQFPEGTYITKIVSEWGLILYVTLEGLCYYSKPKEFRGSFCPGKQYQRPVLLQSLLGRVINDIFVFMFCVVAQYDGHKLCMPQALLTPACDKPKRYVDPADTLPPIDLPFFDDKDIVTIKETFCSIHLVSCDGRVYRSEGTHLSPDGVSELIFFRDNPVAVTIDSISPMIPSALSVLDHDA